MTRRCAKQRRRRFPRSRLDDVKQYYAKTLRPDLTTIVVIGDVSSGGSTERHRKMVRRMEGRRDRNPRLICLAFLKTSLPRPTVPGSQPAAGHRDSFGDVPINRFDPDYYPLQLGNHVLGGGFYATRLYHDLRQVNGYVYNVDVQLECDENANDLYGALRMRSRRTFRKPGN